MLRIGDFEKCKMTDEMAEAFAITIDTMPKEEYIYRREVLLISYDNTGIPVMFVADYSDVQEGVSYSLWAWNGVTVVKVDYMPKLGNSYGLGYFEDEPVFIEKDSPYDLGNKHSTRVYSIHNAELQLIEGLTIDSVHSEDGKTAWDGFGTVCEASVSELLNAGWCQDGKELYLCYINNSPLSFSNINEMNAWINEWNNKLEYVYEFNDFYGYLGYDNTKSASQALRAYSRYKFPLIDETSEADVLKNITDIVKNALDGEIIKIYKLADGVYYVIVTVNGGENGVIVRGYMSAGNVMWKVAETHDSLASEETLNTILNSIATESNIKLDYSKISSSEYSDVADNIRDSLNNIDGLTLNDPAKSELVSYIESAIASLCSRSVSGKDNRIIVSPTVVGELSQRAVETVNEINDLLTERDIKLNKSITVIIRILWQDMDSSVPCQLTLDRETLDSMNGCTLQILMGDAQHYVQISEENLRNLINAFGSVTIQSSKNSDGAYIINFLNETETVIDKMNATVTIGLPTWSSTSTIIVSYNNGSDNWGGQYDSASNIISFDTGYSGRYEVLENNIEINDIQDLSEEMKNAVAFLISKGYMTLNNGYFRPDESLTRYHFSKALVGMFFALDRELALNFPDVPSDSPYYAYVASAAEREIILGYDDGTFRGDTKITTEQMLALAARTLIDYKGYSLPSDAEIYLNAFEDGDAVSEWAKEQVGRAVREGLVDRGGMLDPLGEVTRGEAAVILYRLFLLLHEVPAVALELPPITSESSFSSESTAVIDVSPKAVNAPIVFIAVVSIIIVAIMTVVVLLSLKKRKRIK